MENGDRRANAERYRLIVQGELGGRFEEWFEGFTVEAGSRITVISGPISDQAALFGALLKIRDLGLTLLEVRSSRPDHRDSMAEPGSQNKE
jgi:hypothetical protein